MLTTTLKINPEIVILHRDGMIFTTKLATGDAQIQLQLLDLILLFHFFKYDDRKLVVEYYLSHAYVRYLASSIDTPVVNQRIDNLIKSGVLIADCKEGRYVDGYKNLTSKRETYDESESPHKFKLSSNFALVPATDCFTIYAPIKGCYIRLSLEEMLATVSFLDGKMCSSVAQELQFVERATLDEIFDKLIEGKIIIRVQEHIYNKTGSQTLPERTTSNPSTATNNWEHMVTDDRIPIYFVPHMENHFPLALGLLFSSIQNHKDGNFSTTFNLIPITYFTPEQLLNVVYRKFGRGIWLFSNYMWSIELNLEISKLVKSHDQGNLTIHGGPSTPNYRQASIDFMDTNASVDVSVHGEGEVAICGVLETISRCESSIQYETTLLQKVKGITYRIDDDYHRTPDRARMESPDSIPSPYLEGVFDQYNGRVDAAIIESNRGCPFGCTFCDWGSATSQKVKKYDLERTKKEITWIGKNRTRIVWIADANFGMYERDIELSAFIVKTKEKYGYPQEVVVNYTKNTTWRLAEIIKLFTQGNIISQGIISIQTTDETTLEVINRKNIKTSKYDELAQVFSDENLPLSTDLMIGLPGITVEAFKKDIQKYIDLDVSVKAYPTQLLPNSPMADPLYRDKYEIKTDKDDFVISSHSFTETDLKVMKRIYKFYTIAEGYSLLRYILRFLQWQHQIGAVKFLFSLMEYLNENPEEYPHITWGFRYFDMDKCMPGGWDVFYREIHQYIAEAYDLEPDDMLATVILVNKACMPDDAQTYPLQTELKYDFVEYFNLINREKRKDCKQLKDFKRAVFEVTDPSSMAFINHEALQYDTHQYFWELNSPIARAKSTA